VLEERFGDDEAEDGVAYEFKLLVVGGGVWEGLGFGFVGQRAMSESPGEKFGAAKGVLEQRCGSMRRRGAVGLRLCRLCGFFVASRHRPLRDLLYPRNAIIQAAG
jgi:hypothetical protein